MTFLSVARLGRYTAAAEVLGVNHSTVSRRITALESAMGGRVLVRTAGGWEVTDLGHRAVTIAERIEASLRELVDGRTPMPCTAWCASPPRMPSPRSSSLRR
jgi:DNA-binding transcriptional LysR family regulator